MDKKGSTSNFKDNVAIPISLKSPSDTSLTKKFKRYEKIYSDMTKKCPIFDYTRKKDYQIICKMAISTRIRPNFIPRHPRKLVRRVFSESEQISQSNAIYSYPQDILQSSYKLGLISEEIENLEIQTMKIKTQNAIRIFYGYISNPLTNGIELDKFSSGSYAQKIYPLGLPKCSAQTKELESIFNQYWKIKKFIPLARAKNLEQQSEQTIDAEDEQAENDVFISQNENLIKQISEYGFKYARTTTLFRDEFTMTFGRYGELMLKIACSTEHTTKSIFIKFLKLRAIGLSQYKLKMKPLWCKTQELYLPRCRSKYKKIPKNIFDFSGFQKIPNSLRYNVKLVPQINALVNIYISTLQSIPESKSKNQNIEIGVQKICKFLRNCDPNFVFEFSYSELCFLISSVLLIGKVESISGIINRQSSSRRIAEEIGVTGASMGLLSRLFQSCADIVLKGAKRFKAERLYSLAGLLPSADLELAAELVKATVIAMSTLEGLGAAQEGAMFIQAKSQGGSLTWWTKSMPESELERSKLYIDLSMYKPSNYIV